MFTTQVHHYIVKNTYGNFHYYSVDALEVSKIMARVGKCEVTDAGLVDAKPELKTNSPWSSTLTLYGYKLIHTSRDSRGVYQHDIWVPEDWDDSHPEVIKIRGTAKQEAENENRYYSRLWV